jgi:hypothetical protein
MWFGKSWGAPCCEEDQHVVTPIGEPCARCREPIRAGDQGLISPLAKLDGARDVIAHHLDCYLKGILPHGPECPHCRGAERIDHDKGCAYRERGENCTCMPLETVRPC